MQRNRCNVVFDMGNVLMSFNGMEFARAFTECEADAVLLNDALFARDSWALLDAGVIEHDTVRRIAEDHLPMRLHPALHACLEHWPELSRPLEDVCAIVRDLHERGFGLYLLSNASTRIDLQLAGCPVYPLMDGRVVSGFERIMKPDPAIYRLLCERFDLAPSTCLFVDDNLDNCHGAEVAGMRSFHFADDAAALRRAIDAHAQACDHA